MHRKRRKWRKKKQSVLSAGASRLRCMRKSTLRTSQADSDCWIVCVFCRKCMERNSGGENAMCDTRNLPAFPSKWFWISAGEDTDPPPGKWHFQKGRSETVRRSVPETGCGDPHSSGRSCGLYRSGGTVSWFDGNIFAEKWNLTVHVCESVRKSESSGKENGYA